jgi:hypothetical protein
MDSFSRVFFFLVLLQWYLNSGQSINAQKIISEKFIDATRNQTQEINLLRLPVQKKWILYPSSRTNEKNHHSTTKFIFNFPGRVFIRYKDNRRLFTTKDNSTHGGEIIISSDSFQLVNLFQVKVVVISNTNKNKQNEVKIDLKKKSREKKQIRGHLLVEIIMYEENRIESIQTTSSDIFMIQSSDANNSNMRGLQLISIGPGDIFLHSLDPLYLSSLDVQIRGSGDIQLDLPKLNVSMETSVHVTGSGDFLLKADEFIESTTLTSVVRGAGDICMTSRFMNVSTMNTMVTGSGTASYSMDGLCKQQVIAILGSGDVYAGSIQCSNGTVEVLGSGNVLVQVVHTLKAASPTLGTVQYVGKRPKQILSSELITKNTFPINEAKENLMEKCILTSFPTLHGTFVSIDFSMDETIILWAFIRNNKAYLIGMCVLLAIGMIWHFVNEEPDPKRERQPLLGGVRM